MILIMGIVSWGWYKRPRDSIIQHEGYNPYSLVLAMIKDAKHSFVVLM